MSCVRRFFNLVLLPRIRDDILDYKKLNFHLCVASVYTARMIVSIYHVFCCSDFVGYSIVLWHCGEPERMGAGCNGNELHGVDGLLALKIAGFDHVVRCHML
eukprot:m.157836 g.157836  ORF g.157836 m.157836 type:complete len:102 (-) comp17977_c0_seq2:32-337(-)